jgi:hypothetical protein
MIRGFALGARLAQLSFIRRVHEFVKILSERCVLCKQTQRALRKCRRARAQNEEHFCK